jgi:hypothetical protein
MLAWLFTTTVAVGRVSTGVGEGWAEDGGIVIRGRAAGAADVLTAAGASVTTARAIVATGIAAGVEVGVVRGEGLAGWSTRRLSTRWEEQLTVKTNTARAALDRRRNMRSSLTPQRDKAGSGPSRIAPRRGGSPHTGARPARWTATTAYPLVYGPPRRPSASRGARPPAFALYSPVDRVCWASGLWG